ncbi:HepT-like ribonuclease domain-containing protein [Mesorhizobium sp. WSM2239]|uniref:HepT-like ribonuclease domain-containing protein n=2 Tax=unclassified Mesorhizobium TaxID=325217 RepID=A0AAU8DH75_9HYPH
MAAAKNPLVRLYHIRDEIQGVTLTLADVDFDSYAASYSLKRTVERALHIISEAVKALPDDLLDRYPTPD